jgi:hypothetical protein
VLLLRYFKNQSLREVGQPHLRPEDEQRYAGMRGPKGTPWEGGTRAASFWRWSGTLQPADVNALTTHIDLTDKVRQQVEGRSLVPLLKNPNAPWSGRILFTHGAAGNSGKSPGRSTAIAVCAIRAGTICVKGRKDGRRRECLGRKHGRNGLALSVVEPGAD